MTDDTTPSRKNGSGKDGAVPADLLTAADDLVAAARSKPSTGGKGGKKGRKAIRKLGRDLDAARSAEAKRLRQTAKAQRALEKRERQVADAGANVRVIVGRIRDVARAADDRPSPPAPKPTPAPVATASSAKVSPPKVAAPAKTPPPKPTRARRSPARAQKPTA